MSQTPDPGVVRVTITEAQLLLATKAHDREDAAQKGEPSPWEIDADDSLDPDFKSERLGAMIEAFGAVGIEVVP